MGNINNSNLSRNLVLCCALTVFFLLPVFNLVGQEITNGRQKNLIHVETGLDVLIRNNYKELSGKAVGILTNHSALSKDGTHIADLFHDSKNVNLIALFGPEHGIRGEQQAGIMVKSNFDSLTGVPIYSLYTKRKKPTKEMLAGLDVLVFDIQDVGARFYTYIYSMALAMEAAALHKKQFIVLDRPNPITGLKVEGPMLRDGFESFVGMYKLPVRHGLTVGELALMFKGEKWIAGADSLDLKVIKINGWKRQAWLDESDIPWVAPSPNMSSLATAAVYPGACLVEGTIASEGRGTDKPFEKVGAPWVDAEEFASELNMLNLPGVQFEALNFTPHARHWVKFKDEQCNGVFIKVLDRNEFMPVKTGVSIVWMLKKLYPKEFAWSNTIDRLYGSDNLRKGVDEGRNLDYFVKDAAHNLQKFMKRREKYLLYE